MRSFGRLFVVMILASCAVGVLWLAVRSQAVSLPEPACAGSGPAEGDVSAAGSVSTYLPLVARDAVATYTFPLPSNLPAVEALYPLTDAARAHLQQRGFVVLGAEGERYLSRAYIRIAWDPEVLVLVTSDAMASLFHLVLDDLLKTVEKETLYSDTLTLVQALQADSEAVYAGVPAGQPLVGEAARHNVVVMAVARSLLEPDFVPPAAVVSDVLTYTHKISEHTAVELYPGDDYTQYEPRGHYAGDAQLERYFRAIKWLGRRIYRLQDDFYPHDADVELVAAVLLARMLEANPVAWAAWQRVYEVTRLLCGPADSIAPPLVTLAVSRTFGFSFTVAWLEDAGERALLRDELLTGEGYPTSEIIPVPTLPGQMPLRYVQVMGERYLPDAEVMQETTYPHTGRTMPGGLDVMAALLASERADALLADEKAQYPELAGQLAALRAQFGAYTETWWTRSTYNSWLYSMQPLLASFDATYPRFMQSAAWERKELNAALASWAHLRHDFILYGKQPYPPGMAPVQGSGLVEPVPAFYARLGDACEQVSGTLAAYGMLPARHAWALDSLVTRLEGFAGYAAKILAGEPLSEREQDDIHCFGFWLRWFFDGWEVEEEMPLTVADVATDPGGRVLHEGVGSFNPIVVIYEPADGEALAGVGFVMSYYEFALPNWERMTDQEWQTQVLTGTSPARPWWVVDLLDGGERGE